MQSAIQGIFPSFHLPLLLIGVIFYALIEGPVFGAVIGCFAGFLMDMLCVGKMGSSMTLFSLTGMLTGFSAAKIFYDSILTQILLPVLANILVCGVNLFVSKSLPQGEGVDLGLMKQAFFVAQPWFVAPASLLVFSFLKNRALNGRERRAAWKPE